MEFFWVRISQIFVSLIVFKIFFVPLIEAAMVNCKVVVSMGERRCSAATLNGADILWSKIEQILQSRIQHVSSITSSYISSPKSQSGNAVGM